jgi:vitamin B12 transporter
MKSRKFILCVAVFFICLPTPLLAIGTLEDQGEDIFSLGEVVVDGRFSGIEAGEMVDEITAEELKTANARTLDEALNLLSEVDVRVGNEGVPRVNIRGFKSRHVLLLLDGIPMNSSFDQQFDPSLIPVEQIAKIKVTSGASSVLYGQGGLGGVINVITKKGQMGLHGKAGYEAGDGQPYLAKASLSGGSGIFDFFASGSAYKRDKFPLAEEFDATLEEGDGYRKNSDSERNNAFINLGVSLTDELYVALTGNWVQGSYGKPLSAIQRTITGGTFDPYAPAARYGRVEWYEGYTVQLAADYTPSDLFNLRGSLFYNRMDQDNVQYDDEDYDSIDDPYKLGSYKLRNTGITSGASLKPKFYLGEAGTVTLGLSAEWDFWRDKGLGKPGVLGAGDEQGTGSPPFELEPVSSDEDFQIYSAAVEYEFYPFTRLGIAIGYAHHWQIRDEDSPDDYSVSASVHYDLFDSTRLKAAYQRNIRFPSLSQLYMKDSNNPYLKPEIVYHYQAGIEQKLWPRTLLKLEGFYSEAHDFIAKDQREEDNSININYSLFKFTGAQASLDTTFWENLVMRASYTYLHSKDCSGSGMDELQYVPRDKFTFSGKYDFDFGLTPFVSLNWVANTYVYTKGNVPIKEKAKMKDYFLVNLKLNQRLWKDRLILYVGADNLFNENYEQSYGVPRPGRFIYGGLEVRFDI